MRQSPPLTSADASGPSLADLEQALQTTGQLSAVRRRDLRSAVARVAAFLGEDPARLRLDLESLAARLSAVNPVAAGLSAKRLANIRSDFLAAVRQSGLHLVMPPAKSELSLHWQTMMARLPAKRHRLGCENASNDDPFRMLCIPLINQVNRLAGWGHVSRQE